MRAAQASMQAQGQAQGQAQVPASTTPQLTPAVYHNAAPARGNAQPAPSTTSDAASSGREQSATRQSAVPENTAIRVRPGDAPESEVSFAARLTPLEVATTEPLSAPALDFTSGVFPSSFSGAPNRAQAAQDIAQQQAANQAKPGDAPSAPTTPAPPTPIAEAETAPATPSDNSKPQGDPKPQDDPKPQYDPKPQVEASVTPGAIIPQSFATAPLSAPATPEPSSPRGADIKGDSLPTATADAVGASEVQSAAAAPAGPAVGLAQEISVRVSQPAAPAVDLHISERGGEIHVSVRTPDAALETSLRQNLPTLTNSLERAGYHTETFVPQSSSSAQTSSREDSDSSHPDWSGRGNSDGASQNGRQQQQSRDQREKSWIEALENAQ
ncbi:MAG TPA: flagellar hook-length control protein FliK [Bryobacteraceae bacterium]|nr:flagellar hook-length control protein FliK [Bryobacteraceae bacterium]